MDQEENLKKVLFTRQREVNQKWYNRMMESYPPEMRNFWENKESRFAQPVPYTIAEAMSHIYGELIKTQPDQELVYSELQSMMRICAVQNLSPSGATRVLFQLKDVIREEAYTVELRDALFLQDLQEIETFLDQWTLQAFDIYMGFREKIYELRMKEVRNQLLI